jgi:AraC-like DNA-binding protein
MHCVTPFGIIQPPPLWASSQRMSNLHSTNPSTKSTSAQDLFAERIVLTDGVHVESTAQMRLCLVLESHGGTQIFGLDDPAESKTLDISAGDLWIFPANALVQWRVGARLLCLNIMLGLQSATYADAQFAVLSAPAAVEPLAERQSSRELAITAPLRLLDPALNHFACMAAQTNLSAFEAPFLNALAQTLFIHLAAKSALLMAASQHAPVFDQDAQNVADLRNFVDERLAYDLGVEDLAKQVQMSKCQLLRVMKKHFAQTPQQFVIQRRIERAKALLRGSNASLADIAFQTGFSSQSHLSNTFKQLVGNTPKAYRDGLC